jgi:hypothetical protein
VFRAATFLSIQNAGAMMEPIAIEEVKSIEPAGATDDARQPSRLECLGGVIVSPVRTFEHLAAKPQWFVPIAVMILYVLVSHVVRMTAMFVTMMPSMPESFGERAGGTFSVAFAVFFSSINLAFSVGAALVIFLLMAYALFTIARIFKSTPKFSAVAATLAYAEFVPRLVRVSIKEFIPLLTGSSLPFPRELPTGIAPIFSEFDLPIIVNALLARIELFHLWSFALVAIAVRFTAKVSRERAMLITLLYWVVCILTVAGWDTMGEMLRSYMMG